MLNRKRILMITGAGSSMVLGLPSVSEINKLYDNHSLEFAKGISENSPVHVVKNLLDQHCMEVKHHAPKACYNDESKSKTYEASFESIQYALNLLSSIQPEIPIIDSGRKNQSDFLPLHKLLKTHEALTRIDSNILYAMQASLRFQVYKLFIERMKGIDTHVLYPDFKNLLRKIRRLSDFSIATLNYDDLLLKMLPNLNNGFDRKNGPFRPEKLINSYWDAHLHLHGSIHMRSSKKTENRWIRNPSVNDFHLNMGDELRTDEGLLVNTFPMIIGYNKPDAILCNPYRLYFSVLERLIFESDVIIFVGYGFGDLHLNRYLSAIRYYRSQSKLLLIIDNKKDDYSIDNDEQWSRVVRTIFNVRSNQMPFLTRNSGDGFIERRIQNIKLLIWTHGLERVITDSDGLFSKLSL